MIKDEYSTREIDALLSKYRIEPAPDGKKAAALTVWPRFGTLRGALAKYSAYSPAVRTRFGRPLLDGGQWADLLRDTASPRFSAEPLRPRPRAMAQRLASVVMAPEPEPVFRGMARCPCGWATEWHYGDQAAVTDWVEARRMQHWKVTGHSPRI